MQYKRVISFGDSFTYGNDLSDWVEGNWPAVPSVPSKSTWPALIAKHYDLDYQCLASPGIGNLRILEALLNADTSDSICIVNWSWIDRFDFCSSNTEEWETVRPSGNTALSKYYYKNFHGQYQDMLSNLIYINTAINYLQFKNVKFFMTAIDSLLFEKIMPSWHNPSAVETLQSCVLPFINYFDQLTFLEWSRDKHFPISDKWHPLEEAHQAAFEYIRDNYDFTK
jgi:hypothetical protein